MKRTGNNRTCTMYPGLEAKVSISYENAYEAENRTQSGTSFSDINIIHGTVNLKPISNPESGSVVYLKDKTGYHAVFIRGFRETKGFEKRWYYQIINKDLKLEEPLQYRPAEFYECNTLKAVTSITIKEV